VALPRQIVKQAIAASIATVVVPPKILENQAAAPFGYFISQGEHGHD
jgi:hypothetical protein